MKKSSRLTASILAICIAILMLSLSLHAQESKTDATKKAETEMKDALGTVPLMMKAYPDHLRAGAWEWFKSFQSPDAAIPPKYAQLISLAVSSQIPCSYCIYAHTTMAKMLGATEEEIQEAVAAAAETRHWSTVLNGASVPLEEFEKEWDAILEHMKKHSEAEEKTKK